MAGYVLDTSAILAMLLAEEGFERVEAVLRQAEEEDDSATDIQVPFLALMEVEYQLLRELTAREVEHWLDVIMSWPVQVIESFAEWRHVASAVKADGGMSLADAWMAALALLRDAVLVHKDPEFDAIKDLAVLRLPYDRDAGAPA